MIDIVITSLPFIEFYLAPAAPAALKGHLEIKGFKVKTLDLNIDVKNTFTDKKELNDVCSYFSRYGLTNFDKLSEPVIKKYNMMFDRWAKQLMKLNPKFIGLSVFSNDSQKSCLELLKKLKKLGSKSKIVIGGMGVNESFLNNEPVLDYVDYYIIGEGENALVNLLKGNYNYPGINGRSEQIQDLNSLGIPNYDDYDFSQYDTFYESESVMQITGSRGCVRNCTFCTINSDWPNYKWRSGDHIVQEIKKVYEDKGIRHFYFTDSLINGNMKSYMQMVSALAKFNYENNANIQWGGQYIVRRKRGLPEEYFVLTSESGAYNLALGVESGSDKVLSDMRKGYTSEDLDYFIEKFEQYRITCSYLMLIGYPTETDDDFQKTLDLFYRHAKYVASGTIHGATLNITMQMSHGTPIMREEGKLWQYDKKRNPAWGWTSLVVPNLDWSERFYRRLTAQQVCDMLNWPTISADREIRNLQRLNEEYLEWKKTGTLKKNIDSSQDRSFMTQL